MDGLDPPLARNTSAWLANFQNAVKICVEQTFTPCAVPEALEVRPVPFVDQLVP